MFKIKTYNAISVKGLERFARDKFEVGSSIEQPDAILLRSHKLQGEPVPDSLLAVARAGAGVNNIPVDDYGKQGIVGLGAIGSMVADMALALGMKVLGFDPALSIDAAWRLSNAVQRMENLPALLGRSDYVSLHVPALDATRHMINAQALAGIKPGAVLLNFARESIVDPAAVLAALQSGKLGRYVCDFPEPGFAQEPKIIALPHIGASTEESEENCAVMGADQLIDFLENGHISNSVNYPAIRMDRTPGATRITIANDNVAGVLGHVLGVLADAQVNVLDMSNRSRDALAYNIIDVESAPDGKVIETIRDVGNVIRVRVV